jgi:hypothetical protein
MQGPTYPKQLVIKGRRIDLDLLDCFFGAAVQLEIDGTIPRCSLIGRPIGLAIAVGEEHIRSHWNKPTLVACAFAYPWHPDGDGRRMRAIHNLRPSARTGKGTLAIAEAPIRFDTPPSQRRPEDLGRVQKVLKLSGTPEAAAAVRKAMVAQLRENPYVYGNRPLPGTAFAGVGGAQLLVSVSALTGLPGAPFKADHHLAEATAGFLHKRLSAAAA